MLELLSGLPLPEWLLQSLTGSIEEPSESSDEPDFFNQQDFHRIYLHIFIICGFLVYLLFPQRQ